MDLLGWSGSVLPVLLAGASLPKVVTPGNMVFVLFMCSILAGVFLRMMEFTLIASQIKEWCRCGHFYPRTKDIVGYLLFR